MATGWIGIRGPHFEVSVEPDGNGYVQLFSAQLEITEKQGGHGFSMDAGRMVTFAADGPWGKPVSTDALRPSL